MQKQTRLGDDAMIYQPRKKQTEKEKLREMSFREKVAYIREYYKFHIIGSIVAVAIIIYIVYGIVNPAPATVFYAAMVNNAISEDVIQEYSNNFAGKLELNTERESVNLSTNFNFGPSEDQYTMGMRNALTTYIAANEIDVIIAPESEFKDYAYIGYFSKLSDKLPTDIYSSLTDNFYMAHTEEDAESSVYGIYLTDTKLYKDNSLSTEPYVLGILVNAPNNENSIEFIRFLFNNK